MLISQIAEDQLTPAAKTKIAEAMATFGRKEGDYDFVSAACWMDDIRARTRDYNEWHYVNLPFTAEGTPVPEGGNPPDVIWGLRQCLEKLQGEASPEDKAEALVMLLHLEGDVHQPLHTTSDDDAGGNKREIANLRSPKVDLLFSKGNNLHYFWDSAYRRVFKDGKAEASFYAPVYLPSQPLKGHQEALPMVREQASLIEKEFPKTVVPDAGDPMTWALESHRLGYDFGYGKLPKPQSDNTYHLTQAYIDEARDIARKQVAIAGYRLGELLNAIYGQ